MDPINVTPAWMIPFTQNVSAAAGTGAAEGEGHVCAVDRPGDGSRRRGVVIPRRRNDSRRDDQLVSQNDLLYLWRGVDDPEVPGAR